MIPAVPGTAIGASSRAGLVERRLHRDHHLVVVAVVATLDLDDAVPAGGALGHADGVHRRLGAGVGEPPHRQSVALGEQLGDLGVELARGDVQRAVGELGLDGPPDDRVHVTGEQGAEAHVVVDVLVAVDVDHPRARRRGARRWGAGRRPGSWTAHRAGRTLRARSVARCEADRALGVADELTFGDGPGSRRKSSVDDQAGRRVRGGLRYHIPWEGSVFVRIPVPPRDHDPDRDAGTRHVALPRGRGRLVRPMVGVAQLG